jgi:dihydrofolate synthase/folylpolyglutamate synthase
MMEGDGRPTDRDDNGCRMNERAALAYLNARARLGIKFGLEAMRALVAALGHPEARFPVVLVAGTNGKGSVAAYTDAVFRASGLRSGRYTSPHLVRVHERITVGGRSIPGPSLARAVTAVRDATEALVRRGLLSAHPTYFEAVTAAAFVHFASRKVEVAVVEVGLGGRLDATNVTSPVASAIVSIDYDHQEFLGPTLAGIAAEKAGVMRADRVTVLGPLPADARVAIEAAARASGARLVFADRDTALRARGDLVAVTTPLRVYGPLRPLPGAFQHDNLRVALRLVEEARAAGVPVSLARVKAGIAQTRWPGRLERVPGRPPLLLDGAHNPAGARALSHELQVRGRRFVLLFGAMADKAVEEMAQALFPQSEAVILTAPRMPRAAAPEALAARAGGLAPTLRVEPDLRRALALARRLAGPRQTVVVAGSLYLVGAVKEILERERERKRTRSRRRVSGRRA